MKERMEYDLIEPACRLLADRLDTDGMQAEPLTPDGSLRRFCRLLSRDGSRFIAVAPPVGDDAGLCEAVSGWQIGRHLFDHAVPIPELYGFDDQSGLLVCEDLGDVRLHDLIEKNGCYSGLVADLYRQAVVALARMQVHGRKHFDCSWCWDTGHYDRQLMLKRESGYFLQALCFDMLQLDVNQQEIEQEFLAIADRAGQAAPGYFLHRDFQSRNIMVQNGRVRFIDYQAGRLGPVAYDLASLLIDPYAGLPEAMQEELVECYLDELTSLVSYDRQRFREEYIVLAMQRNLQILGAFAFLSNQRGKPFFLQYIKPALYSLQALLHRDNFEFPHLNALVRQDLTAIDKYSLSSC